MGKNYIRHKYRKGFMQRHGNNIKAKRGVKYDSKCSDWCTYQNFETMYTEVYSEMVASGIAMKLDSPMWLNKAGDIVNYEELAFSKKTNSCFYTLANCCL